MRTFYNIPLAARVRQQLAEFEYSFSRLLAVAGLVAGTILLSISLAYILANFSPVMAVLFVFAVPAGIILVTRPQLGLLLVIFALSFEELSNSGPGVSSLKLLSVVVFGGAVVHFLIFRRKESLVHTPQNWLIFLFIMVALLSNFVALDASRTLDGTERLIRVLTLYIIVINLVHSPKGLRYLIWIFLISGFISAVWGLLDPAQAGQRLYGTMGQPNNFAIEMVPRLPLLLGLLRVEKGVLKRGFLLTMLVVITYGLMLSGSRGGLIAAGCALIMFVLTQENKIVWFALVIIISITGLIAMPTPIKQRVGLVSANSGDELGNSTDRRETYQIYGFQLWQENPILGVGLDGFAEAYTQSEYRFLQKNATKRVAHNTYLEIAVGTGTVGLIVFLSLLGWSLYTAWKYAGYFNRYPLIASISAGLFAGQGGYFVGILFGSRQYEKSLWLLIALPVVVQALINAAEQRRLASARASRQAVLARTSANGGSF